LTPIAMHVMDGHALTHTATVIQLHIAAMYLPSLFSGALIRRFGALWMIRAGIAITLGCIALAFTGRGVMHYALALVLLGLGWNFLFVAGTTPLARTHRPEDRFRAGAGLAGAGLELPVRRRRHPAGARAPARGTPPRPGGERVRGVRHQRGRLAGRRFRRARLRLGVHAAALGRTARAASHAHVV